MKKSSRRPSRRALEPNESINVSHKAFVIRNAPKGQFITEKVEGEEILSKVKKYEPVFIKGYKFAF